MTKFSFIKKVKLNKKLPLVKQTALLIAILLMLVMAALAWFGSKENATASGLNVTMASGKNMLISLNGGTDFVSAIDLLSEDDQKYISETNRIKGSIAMTDITSNGVNFLLPVFNETDGQRIPNTASDDWKQAITNRAYISETIVFRTPTASQVFVGSGTGITTSAEADKMALVSSNPDEIGNHAGKDSNGNNYNFSRDCVVGSLRISAFSGEKKRDYSDESPLFLCIPRSDIELDKTTFTMKSGTDVSTNAKVHEYYPYSYKNGTETAENVIYDFSTPQYIATTTKMSEGVYEATVTINIWIEGCDAETVRALAGGKFNINFDFTATEISQ